MTTARTLRPTPTPPAMRGTARWPAHAGVIIDAGAPLCVIETLAVDIVPFSQVSADFAAAEGEGDGSLAFWRDAHAAYFSRDGARAGRPFDPYTPVVCDRFRLRYPPAGG